MTAETHSQLASFIWSICNLLRGPYKRNEYRKVILPLTVLRRFDCLLAPTKAAVLEEYPAIKKKPETVVRSLLQKITKRPFYNLSKLDFKKLLDDPNQLAPNLNSYINKFSPNVRGIMERFGFDEQIARMSEKNLLYEVIKAFAKIDLSSAQIDNVQMGYIFEELIRIGAEQANEEAGEHFTPREVIKLMVNLLLSPEKDLTHSHVVKTIYDPACGTGGMLSVSEHYIRELNNEAKPMLYGQDWNDDAWAVCKSDMLIKGEDADNIILGDTFSKDGFPDEKFDYMLANPPFGVEWKQQQRAIEQERDSLGFQGRFGAGTPRVNDGALLFLQHMLSKMRDPKKGGSRLGIVFNGSPLFTGDAGGGESEIRRWIIENDWLEAIVALPEQLFYNTGISTYLWVLTNRKEKPARARCSSSTRAISGCRWRKAWATNAAASATHPTRRKTPTTSANSPKSSALPRRPDAHLHRGRPHHPPARPAPARRQQDFRQRRLRLPQDHRRAPAAAELPGQRRTHRPARRRERLQEPRHQREERPRRPPAGNRGWPAAAGRNPRTAPRLRQSDQGKLFKDREGFLAELRKLDRRSATCA